MKNITLLLTVLATASAAFAEVDPSRPMVTGRGNVTAQPAKVIVANQNLPVDDTTVMLDAITITGSLIKHPTKAVPAARR